MFAAQDVAVISALGTAVVALAAGLAKALVELKKARIVEQEVDAQTIFTGYNHLYIELKEQINSLKLDNEKDRHTCDMRIADLEARHAEKIKGLSETHAREVRELRLRISTLESRIS
jgi:hypothetical protein